MNNQESSFLIWFNGQTFNLGPEHLYEKLKSKVKLFDGFSQFSYKEKQVIVASLNNSNILDQVKNQYKITAPSHE